MGDKNSYDDWARKISKAAGVIEQPSQGRFYKEQLDNFQNSSNKKWKNFFIGLGVFCLAFIPRVFFIFFVSGTQNAGVGWYNDSYHHWQIAYLTSQIGLSKGFLRLWDLQGMEYFWGLLHPLILSFFFIVTGSSDILIPRLLNTVLGSGTMVVLYALIKRDFNWKVALGVVFLAAINPIGIFTDTSGMQEPLGIFIFLLGIYFWPQKPWLTAIFWFLASMTRAEYWVFVFGLIFAVMFFDKNRSKKLGLITTYGFLILFYLKYLLDKTGNAIYPIYWNFIGNAAGKWEANIPLTQQQLEIRNVFFVILLAGIISAVYVLWKKPRLYLFSLLGIGNFLFLALFVGFSQYLKSYLPRFWVDRIFWLPYIWLLFVITIFCLWLLPKYLKTIGFVIGVIIIFVLAVLSQYLWIPIKYYSTLDTTTLSGDMSLAQKVVLYYQNGSILIPGNDPIFTYALYKNGIQGKDIRGEMFDPFYYMPPEPFTNWSVNRKIMFSYLRKEHITLFLFDSNNKNDLTLIDRESSHFIKLASIGKFQLYTVKL